MIIRTNGELTRNESWLIKQLKVKDEKNEKLSQDLFVAKADNARLRTALEFYSIPSNHTEYCFDNAENIPYGNSNTRVGHDKGDLARQALASSTSGAELLSAIHMAIEALGSSEMMLGASIYFESRHRSDDQSRYRADLVESEKLTKQALSALKKALVEQK